LKPQDYERRHASEKDADEDIIIKKKTPKVKMMTPKVSLKPKQGYKKMRNKKKVVKTKQSRSCFDLEIPHLIGEDNIEGEN